MDKFSKGDRIMCINSWCDTPDVITVGNIYTVASYIHLELEEDVVWLVGIPQYSFKSSLFKMYNPVGYPEYKLANDKKPESPTFVSTSNMIQYAKVNIGIEWLTGEACNLSMRGLCKMSEQAWKLFYDFHGIRSVNVNSMPETMFLSREDIEELTVFYLCHFYGYVVQEMLNDSGKSLWQNMGINYICCETREQWLELYNERIELYDRQVYHEDTDTYENIPGRVYKLGRVFTGSSNPNRGFSNICAFWGNCQ